MESLIRSRSTQPGPETLTAIALSPLGPYTPDISLVHIELRKEA